MANIVVGITGGIAAYKAIEVIRKLCELGHDVKAIPTANALRFVGKATLEAISHNPVEDDLFTDVADVKHVALAAWADLIVVAPATASFLARTNIGLADDLLGNTISATAAPVVIAPAMHTEMWLNAATTENVESLRSRGFTVLQPAVGRLTGGDSGIGRLPEPDHIVSAALEHLRAQDLVGIRILVTAGGTREPIDPVRFIGNRSSGKQGIAIAREASRRGAIVHLIAANISDELTGINSVTRLQTAGEMQRAVADLLASQDVLIMAAAVSDFRVEQPAELKIKKSEDTKRLSLDLVENPDILAESVRRVDRDNLDVLCVGFAAETAANDADLLRLAQGKLATKGCQVLVANNVRNGAVFDADENSTLILTASGKVVGANGNKVAVANQLLDVVHDSLTR